MGKKKSQKQKQNQLVISDANPIAELTYAEDPLFAVAAHPTKPLLLSGLATGHVHMNKYNDRLLQEKLDHNVELAEAEGENKNKHKHKKKKKLWSVIDFDQDREQDEENLIETVWKTKRHKLSCRIALMDVLDQGESVYTIGKDNVIKKAFTETGKVDFKSKLLEEYTNEGASNSISCAVLSSTHPHLVTGDELGNVAVYDTRSKFAKLFEIPKVHDDMVNQIVHVPNGSVYHYISAGSTTVAKFDLRKPNVLLQSENQEDEVLSACFPTVNSNDMLLCGMGSGVITQWKEKKNDYVDQLSRIKLSKEQSIDSIISTMNDNEPGTCWAGCSDGIIYKVDGKKTKILETRMHDEFDEINTLDIDYDYRLISAGMSSLKIWSNRVPGEVFSDNDGKEDESDADGAGDNDGASDSSDWNDISGSESDLSDSDVSDAENDNDSDDKKEKSAEKEAEKKAEISKKRKQDEDDSKKEAEEKTAAEQNKKQKKPSKKLLHSLKTNHENGIAKFDDL